MCITKKRLLADKESNAFNLALTQRPTVHLSPQKFVSMSLPQYLSHIPSFSWNLIIILQRLLRNPIAEDVQKNMDVLFAKENDI